MTISHTRIYKIHLRIYPLQVTLKDPGLLLEFQLTFTCALDCEKMSEKLILYQIKILKNKIT